MSAPQRSPEWFKEREGKLTASMFGQAAGLGPSSRQALWRRLKGLEVFEGNEATQWGEDHEAEALLAYQQIVVRPSKPTTCGFIAHPTYDWLGASPDFLIADDAVGEIKCPFTQQLYDEIAPYYMAQVQGQLWVTNRQYAHFICWTPSATRVWEIERSHDYWDWLHLRLADFWSWVVADIEPPRAKKSDAVEPPKVEAKVIAQTFQPSHTN